MEDRVQEALERATAYAGATGGPLAEVYLAALRDPSRADRFAESLLGWAEPDGALAWPFPRVAAPTGVASTTAALEMLAAVGTLDSAVGEGAAAYLMTTQGADGRFPGESPEADAALLSTGHLLGFLGRSPFVRHSALARAEAYLAAHWSIERARSGRLEPLAAYLHALSAFPSDVADEALQWCGRELERGYRTGAFSAPGVAHVFVLCEAFALPGASIDARELALRVAEAQAPDGGFGGTSRVRATLRAVTALSRLGAGG